MAIQPLAGFGSSLGYSVGCRVARVTVDHEVSQLAHCFLFVPEIQMYLSRHFVLLVNFCIYNLIFILVSVKNNLFNAGAMVLSSKASWLPSSKMLAQFTKGYCTNGRLYFHRKLHSGIFVYHWQFD
jgi:hypothetical protein